MILVHLLIVALTFGRIQCEFMNETIEDPIIRIDSGSIKGRVVVFRNIQVYQFLCIPYGDPPIGVNRFKKPLPKSSWSDILSVQEWGPYCTQLLPQSNVKMSEDCLCLNVFAPSIVVDGIYGERWKGEKNVQLRPVMVYIHGGSFKMGSAAMNNRYDGTVLAALHNVIIVTVNYRLGVFGFLHLPEAGVPGNMGFWDQKLALQWVQNNIRHFGGDPKRVTIFGESAGSQSVSAHVLSPQSVGLFVNAIMQSGSIYFGSDANETERRTQSFLKVINCTSEDASLCLESFQYSKYSTEVDPIGFFPTYGDDFLPVQLAHMSVPSSPSPGITNKINLLVGAVGNEGAYMMYLKDPVTFSPDSPLELNLARVTGILNYLFGPTAGEYFTSKYNLTIDSSDSDRLRLQLTQIVGDVILTCPTYVFARDVVGRDNIENVYSYYQSQKPTVPITPTLRSNKWLPATHTDDILPVFGYPFIASENYSREDVILSSMMTRIWTTFAETGKPPSIGPYEWPNWTKNSDQSINSFTMEINSQKIGPSDLDIINRCFANYPFPLEKSYDLKTEIGKLSQV